jgi:type III pantothenate kinase
MSMFLAIDIGNSGAKLGIFDGHKLTKSFRIPAPDSRKKDIGEALAPVMAEIAGLGGEWKAGLSSVAPSLTPVFVSEVRRQLGVEPSILTARAPLEFKLRYNPDQLGSDRLANVIAARKLYGFPAIVIDMGTATKYEVIDHLGDYLGGLIAPGAWSSAEALFERAEKLFPVELEKPDQLIADNTVDALKSGIFNGFLGQVENVLGKLIQELGYTHIRVVATGGQADIFVRELAQIETVDSHLTLKGIETFFNR